MRLNTPKRHLLLIRGLGHSGTTILDLALGAHSQITGLGEAVRLLEKLHLPIIIGDLPNCVVS